MRNFFAGFSGSSGAVAAGIVCLVLIAAGFWVQSGRNVIDVPNEATITASSSDKTEQAMQPAAQSAPSTKTAQEDSAETVQPDQDVTAQSDTGDVTEDVREKTAAETDQSPAVEAGQSAEAPAPPAPAPEFDEVRREADGVTVIAGRGVPGAEVQVLQNGVMVASAMADRSGKFATIALIPPDGEGHVLTLMQVTEAGEQSSDGEIILAPLAPPSVVAAVAAPETQETQAEDSVPASSEADDATAPQEPVVAALEPQSDGQAVAVVEEPQETEATDAPVTAEAQNVETAQDEQTSDATATPQVAPSVAPQTVIVEAEDNPPVPPVPSETTEAAPVTAPVAVLRSTSEGVELLNTPSPEVMDNVAIDTISYSDAGDVQLSGRAQSEATAVRVYLDNNAVVNLPVDDEGRWRGNLPNVDEGIYTLRIDEVAADGAVTSRVETPFKREAPATLAAAAAAQEGPITAITVQRGATLWAIARDRYGDGQLYVRVFEANRQSIRDPDLIYPGQIFDLPD